MSTLSEAYRDDPLNLHHIIPLDFDSIESVPESHLWSRFDETVVGPVRSDAIPIIDLANPNTVQLIGLACQTWGMFQVTNHGLPLSLVENVESEAQRFFSLPAQEKRKVLRSSVGATGYGAPRIAPFYSKQMWHEGFTIMGSCVDDAKVLWPHDYQAFCTLSEAYRDDPLNLHHIIPLDFDSIELVPESHLWSRSDETVVGPVRSDAIPIIDLANPNTVQLIGLACQTWGMFQVTNHGLPLSLVENVESEAQRFFSLPAQEKRKVLRSSVGATGYGAPRIAPFYSKQMWHEGFTIMGSCVDDASVLWPHDYQAFCDTMDDYQKKMKALAYQLLLLILESLDVTQEEMDWAASTFDAQGALQLNSYPCCPNPNRAMGLVPHTDSLLLTILHQSNINGLQIFREGIGWISVAPVQDALVANVGDLLHILSNAKFPTVYHRAVVNQSRHRISIAYFYGPPADSMVMPFSKPKHPRYRSLSVKEYLGMKTKHLHKALSLIRI